jgi:hypothetical protein
MKSLKIFATIFLITLASQLLAQTYITSDVTWTSNQGGLGDIYIQEGATLTINSGVTITMGQNTHIYVYPESRLVANAINSGFYHVEIIDSHQKSFKQKLIIK